ncbi:MAG: histidine--tRNA ligase [Candidatus Pacebacteria bacterium]|nr:histidine--tRNA ligase [Candidatus Paceibacterota bacterium]
MSKNNSNVSTEPYKGVRDFYPEDMAIQNHIFSVWKKTVEKFGFTEYNASILEPAELYKAKTSEEIVNEQTYTFTDRGDREVTLRPEMTPTVARMVAGKRRELGFPLRWYSIPNVFRYERPQRGRLREHWQLNVDMFGLGTTEADVELIAVAYEIMKNFGAKNSDFIIKVSSRKLMNAVFGTWYELDEAQSKALQRHMDKKAKMPEEVFYMEAEKIVGKPFEFLNLSHTSSQYEEAMAFPAIRQAKEELDLVISSLQARGVTNVEYDENIIRGFDYYTGTVFEVFDTDPANNRSLFGGGRYDNLMSLFGGESLPAFGFGMGDVTIRDFLDTHGLLPAQTSTTQIMICIMDVECKAYAEEVANELRTTGGADGKGTNVALNYSYKNISDQTKAARKLSIPQVVIIGEDEVKSKTYTIKDLAKTE